MITRETGEQAGLRAEFTAILDSCRRVHGEFRGLGIQVRPPYSTPCPMPLSEQSLVRAGEKRGLSGSRAGASGCGWPHLSGCWCQDGCDGVAAEDTQVLLGRDDLRSAKKSAANRDAGGRA